MVWYISSLLTEDGIPVSYLSDRIGLEEAVLTDTKRVPLSADGSRVGKHSKLIADGPPGHRKVHVLDGVLLNQVHEDMVRAVKSKPAGNNVLLVEYAIGPDIKFRPGKQPLLQSAHHFVERVRKYRAKTNIFVVDVEAPMLIRERREAQRPDAMAPETFRAYFPDGGEMISADKNYLKRRYYQFKNFDEGHEGYYSEVRYIYESMIRPNLKLKT